MSKTNSKSPLTGNGGKTVSQHRYVLITPARNEAAFIELTLKSVIAQTLLPLKWVIVSDGSTDGTDEIVSHYTAQHSWIQLIRTPERQERHFAGKVHAFNAGLALVKELSYEIIGNLDADISFGDDYMSFLLAKFAANSRLGVAGTPFRQGDEQYNYRFTSVDHVSGACQLFRRACFADIGGYRPLKVGGIDLVAVTTARMRGWETRTFTDKVCLHHRKMGTGQHRPLMVVYRGGYHDYLMGVHPLWQFLRSGYQATRPPYLIGGVLLLIGYCWAMVSGAEKPVTSEFVAFRRREQMARVCQQFRRLLGGGFRSPMEQR